MNIQFWLGWFDKEEGDFIGQQWLEGVNEPEIIYVYNIQPDEQTIDSFPVSEEHREWLESKGIQLQLDKHAYFVAGIVTLDS
jgi:hypothetical protein